jgi:biotin carboxyl carrier protein
MKYFVDINGARMEVSLDGEGVHAGGVVHDAHLSDVEGTPIWLLTEGDEVHRLVVKRGDARGRYTIWMEGFRYEVDAVDERTRVIRDLTGATAGPSGPAPLKAPMPGLIVRVNIAVGDTVTTGQGLVVMEAMKMENELRASAAGRVKRILAIPGQAVEKGALLVEME